MGSTFLVSSGLLQKMSWLLLPPHSRLRACVAGEKSTSPASLFTAHTFGLCLTERSEPGNIKQNLETHISWQPLNLTSPTPGHMETGVPRLSDRWSREAQAAWGPPKQSEMPFLSWLSDSLFSLILGGGRKRRMQFITAPRPSILSLEDVGCTYIHLKLFLTHSLLNLFMKRVQEKNELNF